MAKTEEQNLMSALPLNFEICRVEIIDEVLLNAISLG